MALLKAGVEGMILVNSQDVYSMAATVFSSVFISSSQGGLLYAIQHVTGPEFVVLSFLFLGSVFSWAVMSTKFLSSRSAAVEVVCG